MLNAPDEDIQRTISQLGEGDRRDTEIEIAVRRFAANPLTARRLIDWVPEAFGYVLLPHVADLTLPTTFTARAKDGTWKEFGFDREPIFGKAVTIAAAMYKDNPRGVFSAVAKRSTLVQAVNQTLGEGGKVDGTKVAGPALAGVPAEFYEPRPKSSPTSLWRKLIG